MPHPLSLHHLSILDLDPPALVHTAAAAGFDQVCLFTNTMDSSGFFFPKVTRALLRDTQAALTETGITVNNLEVFYIEPGTDVADFREGLEIGAALGGKTCTAIIGEPDLSSAVDKFAGLAELAKAYGIVPTIEFMAVSACGSIDQAMRIATLAGSPDHCLAVDSLHLHRTGGSPADLIRLGSSAIGGVQINDGPFAMPEADYVSEAMTARLLPGDGEFPLRDMIAALPHESVLSVEVPNDTLRNSQSDATEWARMLYRSTEKFLNTNSL